MGYQEHVEGKGVSSFTISQNGDGVYQTNYSKTKLSLSILTVIVLCLSAIFIYYSYTVVEITVCKTKPCLQSTITLMNCMNESVDPCEDFYEFACGMFETNYQAEDDSDENSWSKIITSKVTHKVKQFLTKSNEVDEPEAVHKIRKLYNVCLNFVEGQNEDQAYNYSSLLRVLEELDLDVNYLNDTVALDLEIILAKLKKYFNREIFFGMAVDDDPRNSSSYSLLTIGTIENIMFKFNPKNDMMETNNVDFNENIPKFTEYFQIIIDKLLNRNQTVIKSIHLYNLYNTSQELQDFEEEFSKISKYAYLTKTNVSEIITLRELQILTDGEFFKFNWTLYLREVFRDIEPKVYEQLTLENSEDYEILTDNKEFVRNVFSLLFKTPKTIIKMSILSQLPRILYNFQPIHDSSCFSMATNGFGMVTGYAMINTLDDTSKAALAEMNDNIKWAFHKMVSEATWMDDETKNATYRKLVNTKTYFGYPNNYTNLLNDMYQNLNITDNHLENVLSVSKFIGKSVWKYLLEAKDTENMEWEITPDNVNAYSYNSMNTFIMPAAILQAPLFHNGLQALDYGSTGSTVGHELSHNYDNTGRLYNEYGNMAQWWTDKSYEEYTKRAECMIDHYNFYGHGNETLDENIADVAGLREAFFAYQRYVIKHGQEPRLPGMEQYNPEQLFFLGYALQYCHYDPNEIAHFDKSSVHSSDTVRVRGVLTLVQEFANAWSCPVGTPMNPKKEKCQIW